MTAFGVVFKVQNDDFLRIFVQPVRHFLYTIGYTAIRQAAAHVQVAQTGTNTRVAQQQVNAPFPGRAVGMRRPVGVQFNKAGTDAQLIVNRMFLLRVEVTQSIAVHLGIVGIVRTDDVVVGQRGIHIQSALMRQRFGGPAVLVFGNRIFGGRAHGHCTGRCQQANG